MITDIHLQNYRSYSDDSYEFDSSVNIIVGPNASGKTNLLEAILLNSKGSSYRTRDNNLIKHGEDWARIETNTDSSSRIIKLQKQDPKLDKVIKTYEINTKKIGRLNLDQILPVVLFEPNHLLLLIGSPELRRNYIDDILEQIVPGYKTLKAQYKRALAQRNALLKKSNSQNPDFFIWNIRLSELGGKIFKQRIKLVEQLQTEINNIYKSISKGSESIELSYQSGCNTNNYETDLLKKLENSVDNDQIRGFTSYGTHRDDLKILLNNKEASKVASRGETRTILLALKILETRIIEDLRGKKPILLLDDVFSELDGARRLSLVKLLNEYQTFISTTDADVVIQHFTKTANIILIEKQRY